MASSPPPLPPTPPRLVLAAAADSTLVSWQAALVFIGAVIVGAGLTVALLPALL